MDERTPSGKQVLAYTGPMLGSIFLFAPTWFILPGIYGKYFGLELSTIALVVLYSRVFDALTDPLVGYLSDRHRAKGGSRKPWIAVGGIAMILSSFFFFGPPANVTAGYFLLWSFVFYLSFTIFYIPYTAWASEIAPSYDGRTKLYGNRQIAASFGDILFSLLPILVIAGTQEYTPQVLKASVYIGGVLLLLGLVLSLRYAPNGFVPQTAQRETVASVVRSITGNKPLLLFSVTYLVIGIGFGMWVGLVFLYMDGYLGLGDKIAVIFVLGTIAGGVSIPLWIKLSQKIGKSCTYGLSTFLYSLFLLAHLLLEPDMSWQWMLALTVAVYTTFSSTNFLTVSMLGDIADYGIVRLKKNSTSLYYATNTFIYKTSLGIGTAMALGIAGYFGFDPSQAQHSAHAILGLKLGFIVAPALFGLGGAVLVLMSPINKHRHSTLRRWIDRGSCQQMYKPIIKHEFYTKR